MHPDGPYVERDADTLVQQYKSGQIKADTMVRRQEWDMWTPIVTALNLRQPAATRQGSTNPDPRCAKCGGEMHEGFIVELGDQNISTISRWIAGAPQKSAWWGLTMKGREQYEVQTFRCTSCGYLESYAR